jgi:nucleotide-binding universal stress UspA family protein
MKRVLIPIDGSDCALRAVALVIGKRALYLSPDDLEIHLINVQAPFSSDISRFASHQQISEFHRQQSEEALRGARQLLDAAGIKYRCHIEVGHIAETITEHASALACDQIVMGTHGRGAFKELVMGSIPLKVLALTSVPVLLVK